MVKIWRHGLMVLAATAAGAAAVAGAAAQTVLENQSYLKALAELRQARELVQQAPGEQALELKTQALGEIDAAVHELERANAGDSKGASHPAPVDLHSGGLDPYYRAIKALASVQGDMLKGQDPATRNWRLSIAVHAARARQFVAHAIETLSSAGG
jgi:hypothetical protein